MRDETLWARLQAYAFPMSDGRSLAAQIAAQTVLNEDRAAQAVTEYRKFLYLVATSSRILAPSPLIDRVWHQHLMDTRAYFEVFCPQILGKTLHHIPGRPPAREDGAYLETLAQYQSELAAKAPATMWPTPETMREKQRGKAAVTALIVAGFGFGALHIVLPAVILAIGAAAVWLSMARNPVWAFRAPGSSSSGCGGGSSFDTGGGDSDGDGGGCGGD